MIPIESWQLRQLQILSEGEPTRVQEFMNTLWAKYPHLLSELAISAVDHGDISIEEAAEKLSMEPEAVIAKLDEYHRAEVADRRKIIRIGGIARLANSQVAVWEVAREYRNHRSVALLKESFPSIPSSELEAALRYSAANKDEIEDLIARYETAYAKPRYVG